MALLRVILYLFDEGKTKRAFLRINMFLIKGYYNLFVPAAYEFCELKSLCGYLFARVERSSWPLMNEYVMF